MFIWRISWPGKEGDPTSQMDDQARRVTPLAGPAFCSQSGKGSPHFLRECMKSWLNQGSSGELDLSKRLWLKEELLEHWN